MAEQAQRMDEITLEHGVTVEKVKKLVGGTKHYTGSRSAQLENALMHAKAEEVNKGNVLHSFEHWTRASQAHQIYHGAPNILLEKCVRW
jgi:hypothetical protein